MSLERPGPALPGGDTTENGGMAVLPPRPWGRRPLEVPKCSSAEARHLPGTSRAVLECSGCPWRTGGAGGSGPSRPVPRAAPPPALLSKPLCQVPATSKSHCSRDSQGPFCIFPAVLGWRSFGHDFRVPGCPGVAGIPAQGAPGMAGLDLGGLWAVSRGPLLPETRELPGGTGWPCGRGLSRRGHLPRVCSAHPPQGGELVAGGLFAGCWVGSI